MSGPRSMETVRNWMGNDLWMALGSSPESYPGWSADNWAEMIADVRRLAAATPPARAESLDVERLARALHAECVHRTGDDHWNAHWARAEQVAAEYAALTSTEGERE